MSTIYKLNERKIFKHSHEINLAIYDLNAIALDIFYILISQIKNEDIELNQYVVSITDLERVMLQSGNKSRINRDSLRLAVLDLMDKKIEVNMGKIELYAQWFENIIINREEGYIVAKVSDTLKEHLLDLDKYVKGDLISFLRLKSRYSKILYVLFCKDLNMKTNTYTLSDLFDILNVPESLKKVYSNFKNRALESSIKEINEKTNLNVNFEQIKFGRSVEAIRFDLKEKKSNTAVEKKSPNDSVGDWLEQHKVEIIEDAEIIEY